MIHIRIICLRLTLFPIVFFVSPLFFIISWMLAGTKEAKGDIISLLKYCWFGDI